MENLIRVFQLASPEDLRLAAQSWQTYRTLTRQMAADFGFSAQTGAAVFAALSPNVDYYGNLRDTRRILQAVRQKATMESVKVSTYNNNKAKAWAIAAGAEPLTLLRAPKTRSFFLNINDPEDPIPVTVDGHIFNAWRGWRQPLKGLHLAPAAYEKIATDIRQIGAQMGLIPNQVQAVIWQVWRRLNNIQWSAQLELWSKEARLAGIDFHPFDRPFVNVNC